MPNSRQLFRDELAELGFDGTADDLADAVKRLPKDLQDDIRAVQSTDDDPLAPTHRAIELVGTYADMKADGEGDEPREPLSYGALERRLRLELEAALDAPPSMHDADTIGRLAIGIGAIAETRRYDDDVEIGPVLPPDLVRRAAGALGRAAACLGAVQDVQGRFADAHHPDPELANPQWAAARVLPAGFEDLDPAELARLAGELESAVEGSS